jgi:hypothetical protein
MVEGSLAEALSKGGEEESIKKLCALLLAVDRTSTVEQLYLTSKSTAVQATWEELSATTTSTPASAQRSSPSELMTWLPRFLSWLSTFLENVSTASAYQAGVCAHFQ